MFNELIQQFLLSIPVLYAILISLDDISSPGSPWRYGSVNWSQRDMIYRQAYPNRR